MKRLLAAACFLLLLTLLGIAWVDSRRPTPVMLIPSLTGQPEYCLTCHGGLAQISPAHPTAGYGCVLCHGGERLALDATLAHSTLRGGANPSDPAVMAVSCGGARCHSGDSAGNHNQLTRLQANPHSTYPVSAAVTSLASGLNNSGAPSSSISVTGTPALCLNCHLDSPPLPGAAFARFTGCAACHTQPVLGDLSQPVHRLNIDISYQQCNTCHNRGTLDLHAMTFTPRTDPSAARQLAYYLPGVSAATCEFRLDCVDCHTRGEIMGDGAAHASLTGALSVTCGTCHGTLTARPLTRTITQPDDLALVLAAANPALGLATGDTIIVTAQGEPLYNIRRLADGRFSLVSKVTAQHNIIPLVQGSACLQDPAHQSAQDCHVCHNSR